MYEKKDINTITVLSIISACQKCAEILDEEGIDHCMMFLGYFAMKRDEVDWIKLDSIACHIKDMLWIYSYDQVEKNCVYADMIIHNMIVNWCKEAGMELNIYTK